MSTAQEQVQAALRATSVEDLMTKAYHLTHRMHTSTSDVEQEQQRAMRDLITAEVVLRSMRTDDEIVEEWATLVREQDALLDTAADLLDTARTKMIDPSLKQSWAQRRRRWLDKVQSR